MISEEKLTIGTYTRAKLLADAEITRLLGTKIYPSVAPEGTPSPFIIYERDSYDTSSTKMGVYREESEIVFEVVTDDYDIGMEIVLAMRRVLQGKHGGFTFEIMFSREYYMEKKFRQLLQFKIS